MKIGNKNFMVTMDSLTTQIQRLEAYISLLKKEKQTEEIKKNLKFQEQRLILMKEKIFNFKGNDC